MVSCSWLIGIWMSSTSLDLPSQTERVSSWFAFFIHPFTTASVFQLRLLILLFTVDVHELHRIKETERLALHFNWQCLQACGEHTNSSQKDPECWINKLRAEHWSRCLLFVKAIDTSWSWTPTVYLICQGEWGGVSQSGWMDWIDWHALYSRLRRVHGVFTPGTARYWKSYLHRRPAFSLQETQWLPYLVHRPQHKHCDGLRDTLCVCVCGK